MAANNLLSAAMEVAATDMGWLVHRTTGEVHAVHMADWDTDPRVRDRHYCVRLTAGSARALGERIRGN